MRMPAEPAQAQIALYTIGTGAECKPSPEKDNGKSAHVCLVWQDSERERSLLYCLWRPGGHDKAKRAARQTSGTTLGAAEALRNRVAAGAARERNDGPFAGGNAGDARCR